MGLTIEEVSQEVEDNVRELLKVSKEGVTLTLVHYLKVEVFESPGEYLEESFGILFTHEDDPKPSKNLEEGHPTLTKALMFFSLLTHNLEMDLPKNTPEAPDIPF